MLYQVRLSVNDINLNEFIKKLKFYDYVIVRHKGDDLMKMHYHLVGENEYAESTVRKFINDFGLKGNKQYNLSKADEKGFQYILKPGSEFIKTDSYKEAQIERFRQLSIDYCKNLVKNTIVKRKEQRSLKQIVFEEFELTKNKPEKEDEFITFVIEVFIKHQRVVCKTQLKAQILTLMLNKRDGFKQNLAQQIKEDFSKGWY